MADETKEQKEAKEKEAADKKAADEKAVADKKAADEKANKEKTEVVPLYKFQKTNDKLKTAEAKLKEFEDADKKKKNDELLSQKKYDELLGNKDKEIEDRDKTIADYATKDKTAKINKVLMTAIKKHKPNDAEDVLALLDQSKVTVVEDSESGKITVTGIDEELESLKTSKGYLFGKPKKNDTKDDKENKKSNAGAGDDDDPNKKKVSTMGGGTTISSLVTKLGSARKKSDE